MADLAPTVEQAVIEIDGGPSITCFFNPTTYTISKSNNYGPKTSPGRSMPKMQYTGGNPRELAFDLLLDNGEGARDIQSDVEALFKAMETPPVSAGGGSRTQREPPRITFRWGGTNSFVAGLKSLSAQYQRFDTTGTPTRIQLKVSLIQLEPASGKSGYGNGQGQNPTTRALPARSIRVVRDGDSLQSLAYAAYGDATAWRAIAAANGIDDPLSLRSGMRLAIPERSS
jgi:hypothetical protein